MKYYFLIPLLMFLAKTAHAEETPPPVMENRDFEVRLLDAHIGYSNFTGTLLGARASIAVRLAPKWQWELGFATSARMRGPDTFSAFTGPRFNFSDDLSRSWFIGGGVEYGDRWKYSYDTDKTINGYFEVGKRFRMNQSGSWTYAPNAQWSFDGDYAVLNVRPLAFTYSF